METMTAASAEIPKTRQPMTVLYCHTEQREVETGLDWLTHKSNGHQVETLELKERRRRGPHGFEYQWSSDWKRR